MKKYYLLFAALAVCAAGESFAAPARSATNAAGTARHSTVAQQGGSVQPGRLATLPMPRNNAANNAGSSVNQIADNVEEPIVEVPEKDMREKEKTACQSNNIGMGNTFVWASRTSNIENYSSMIEDTENPENNICFVRVELKSNDTRINIADMNGKYFEMGRVITCGSWVDEGKLEKRILDAKKSARTWATVGGVVGGAGLGVGVMEVAGNKLIGGKVQGQKALAEDDLLESQLLVLKKDNSSKYNQIMAHFEVIKRECDKVTTGTKPANCTKYDYNRFLATKNKQ